MAETKDVILARMLSNIDDEYDKTEGSFFYDATKPTAIELEEASKVRDTILKNAFIEDATGEWLEKKVAEQDIYKKQATKASGSVIVTGAPGAVINIGDKVASDTVNFLFTESKVIDGSGEASINVECEIAGTIGNVISGSIRYFPLTLEGLLSVTNPNDFTNGYNIETDAELRQRYYDKIRTPSTSGNKYHYINWAKEITGISDVKPYPRWNGPNSIKLVLLSSNRTAPQASKIEEVIEYIEDRRPLGADVTVVGAKEKSIDIKVHLILTENGDISKTFTEITKNIKSYFYDIAFIDNVVRYSKIGEAILNSGDVIDYETLAINNQTSNIELANDEIPVLGAIQLI